MNKNLAHYLTSTKAIENEEIALTHGTNTTAVSILLAKGILPPPRYNVPGSDIPSECGYLFFVPMSKYLAADPKHHEDWGDHDREFAMSEAIEWAKISEEHDLTERIVGKIPYDIGHSELFDGPYSDDELRDAGIDIDKLHTYGLEKFVAQLELQRGVVLGLKPNILELNVEPDSSGISAAVKIYCPKGLDAKYIAFIQAMGDLERVRIAEMISNLS